MENQETRDCKYCLSDFEPRRRNHFYCSESCRTMACYERNKYKYRSGSYVPSERLKIDSNDLEDVEMGQSSSKPLKIDSQPLQGSLGTAGGMVKTELSGAGIMNAAIGAAIAKVFEYFTVANKNKPLTKKEAAELFQIVLDQQMEILAELRRTKNYQKRAVSTFGEAVEVIKKWTQDQDSSENI